MSLINTDVKPFTATAYKNGKFIDVTEANFKGVVDLIEMKAILWHDETMGAEYSVEEECSVLC
ncbi:MAG: hypothetical protein B7Z80_22435 [Rhodospirillales bacterium 20-64-7]|nr:MAG: hypothetical protein B7Z80_22435 [Rhodospirillales bacterium 20-64-7]